MLILDGAGLQIPPNGDDTNNESFSIKQQNGERSLKDANAIKYYNGGRYLKLIKEEISTEKSESVKRTIIKRWIVYRNNTNKPPFNYVERICKEKD